MKPVDRIDALDCIDRALHLIVCGQMAAGSLEDKGQSSALNALLNATAGELQGAQRCLGITPRHLEAGTHAG